MLQSCLQGPGTSGGDRHGGLVRLNLTEDVNLRHEVANILLPLDVALGDVVGKGGADDLIHLVAHNGGGTQAAGHGGVPDQVLAGGDLLGEANLGGIL